MSGQMSEIDNDGKRWRKRCGPLYLFVQSWPNSGKTWQLDCSQVENEEVS